MRDAMSDNKFDAEAESERISSWISETVRKTLKRRGAVVGISGGVDSSVVAALCARALGPANVIGLALPEKECSKESVKLAEDLAHRLGIRFEVEDITAALEGTGAYRRRNEAIRHLFPDFRDSDKAKLTIDASIYKRSGLNVFRITVIDEQGNERSQRPSVQDYLQIVAASNMKQRLRMTLLYYHAELRNYAVAGTGNKNEQDQGFFVKYGDGGTDFKPIVHLFKSQVYALAGYLDLPAEIISRPPTTDTYSAEVTQEEFFFKIPFEILDKVWSAHEKGLSDAEIGERCGLELDYIARIRSDLRQKQQTTQYLRLPPLAL